MSAFSPGFTNLTSPGEPERLLRYRVSAGFLSLIGVRPALGRSFLPEEDRPGAPAVAILSHELWKRRFSQDPTIIGQALVLDRNSYTVVGVLPPDFEFYSRDIDVYMPIAASTARVRGMPAVGVHARLKPGVSVAAAQAEIDGLCRRWIQQYHYPKDWGARVWPLHEYYLRDVKKSILLLAVAVALVLLIACANVANLLLARAGTRQGEIAIRSTLGASRGRLVRQLLTENALLGLISALLGLLVAWGGVRALTAASGYLPFQQSVSIDKWVLCFSLGSALLTTLLFGVAPAMATSQSDLWKNLKETGRGKGESARRSRLRATLVVAEVALALLVAIAATLTTRSLARLQAVDLGFSRDGILTAVVTLPTESYPEPVRRVNFFKTLLARLQAMPGVKGAGMVSHLPFGGAKMGADVDVEGALSPKPGEQLIVFSRSIDPKYFPTLQVRLLKGRFFTAQDPAGPPVAIVNDTMARRCWPNQDPIGKRFGEGGSDHTFTVVGIIADLRQTSLADKPDMEAFVPHTQTAAATMALVLRTTEDPAKLAPALRAAVRELDKDLPISNINSLSDSIAHSTGAKRFSTALLAGFAVLAMLLAAVGIYGVISYSVSRRTHEIGVRIALGAERPRILRMVVGRAVRLGGAGILIGIAGGLALTRVLRTMLFGVSATDPLVFTGVSLFLLGVAALAGYIPARRAARVDPIVALRCE